MKGIKLGLVGVCVGLFGLSLGTLNFFAICGAALGVILVIAGCFIKDGE